MKPIVLVSEDLAHKSLSVLEHKYQLQKKPDLWKNRSALLDAIKNASAILIRNQTQLDRPIIEAASELRVIGRVGVGLENIDLAAATERGVVVVAPLEANAVSVSELTLGFILALARKIPSANQSTKGGGWERQKYIGVELQGKTLAICGFGRIGRMVSERSRAFGMLNQIYDPFIEIPPDKAKVQGIHFHSSLEEAVASADFISLHLPSTPETRHLFGLKLFSRIKPGSFLINTSRGGVVDESALIEVLERGQLAGAALDVREMEPPGARSILETMENVILTPHIGAFTGEAQTRTFEAVVADVDRVLCGEKAQHVVNPPQNEKP